MTGCMNPGSESMGMSRRIGTSRASRTWLNSIQPKPMMVMPIITRRRVPNLSVRYPSIGPSIPPSMRVKAKASESCVRVQPKALSSATNHSPIAWNIGVVDMTMTEPVMNTSHQP